jgi:hypothetical protein
MKQSFYLEKDDAIMSSLTMALQDQIQGNIFLLLKLIKYAAYNGVKLFVKSIKSIPSCQIDFYKIHLEQAAF